MREDPAVHQETSNLGFESEQDRAGQSEQDKPEVEAGAKPSRRTERGGVRGTTGMNA